MYVYKMKSEWLYPLYPAFHYSQYSGELGCDSLVGPVRPRRTPLRHPLVRAAPASIMGGPRRRRATAAVAATAGERYPDADSAAV